MDDASDEELYAAWRSGATDAGNELARRHCPPLLRFFANKVPDVADDLVQRTFLACMSSSVSPAKLRSFRALLFGIARKQLMRHFEGRGRLAGEEMMSRVSLADLRTTPTRRIASEQEKTLIHQALSTLPLDQQLALELFYWQRLPVADVAAVFGLSDGGTRNKLFRARQTLRDAYAKLSDDPLREFSADPRKKTE